MAPIDEDWASICRATMAMCWWWDS